MNSWEANVTTNSGKHLIMVPPSGPNIRVAALIAAAAMMGGVTTAGYASSLSPLRLFAERIDVQPSPRDEDVSFSVSEAMAAIKRRTGATWDDLARIFQVSRQAVHGWVKGGAIKAAHEEKVRGLLARIEQLSDIRPFQIRNQLLADAGVAPQSKLLIPDEPAILTADHTPSARGLEVTSVATIKIVRS